MANRRIFYAARQIGMAKDGTTTFIEAHGVQSIGITTNFNLEQVFEQGQLSIYQQVEQVPDIEVTMEKVLDGYPLLYHLATNGATAGTLVGRSNIKATVAMSVFADTLESASGTPIAEVSMSGMTISSLTYTFPTDGNFTEAVTMVGYDKVWRDDETLGTGVFTGRFNDQDQPLAITGSGGVQRRWNLVMVPLGTGVGAPNPATLDSNGATTGWVTTFPTDIPGIQSTGLNPVDTDGTFVVPVQSITITADLGRDSIFELGRKAPYWRFVNFPVEIRTEIEVLSLKWDKINASEAGGNNGAVLGENTKYQTIKVRTQDGTYIQMGTKNRLTSVAMTGGDAGGGGGNVSMRFSYTTFSDLLVTHPADPSGL